MPDWRREHDMPGTFINVPQIERPTTLERLIEICRTWQPGQRLHAVGSHWALSTAAMSDHTYIETHDPSNAFGGIARTLHTVIPNGMNPAFLNLMRDFDPPTFEDNHSEDDTPYFVHVEAGKRIYQIYAELDQPAEDDPDGLAMHLYNTYGTDKFFGPWAFRTLGGAGGQTIVGALTTGTHGGDFLQPPIADDVVALHLVSDGGKHYWIEPGTSFWGLDLTDDDRLIEAYGTATYGPPGNFEIIRDDEVFNAALVSVGRFGIVYSVVLRVVRQYMLKQTRELRDWQDVRLEIRDYQGSLYATPPKNRFLQAAVCVTPYANSTRNLCGVTKRRNVLWDQTTGPPNGRPERVGALVELPTAQRPWPLFAFAGKSHVYTPDENDPNLAAEITLLERACSNPDFLIGLLEEVCEEIRALVEENAVLIGGAVAAVAILGGVSTLLGLLAALLVILAILLAIVAALRAGGGGRRLGQVLDELRGSLLEQPTPELRMAGVFVWQCIAYKIFEDQQKAQDFDAISYAVMDIHDYHDISCDVNVDSVEVFFNSADARC